MKANAKKVGKRIKMLRQKNNLTLKGLEKELSIPFSTINSWERGVCLPRNETSLALSTFFNVDKNWLLYGSVKEYLTDVIKYYGLEEQINDKDMIDFINLLIAEKYTVGNLKELLFYAKKHLPILEKGIIVQTEKKVKNKKSLQNIGNMYPIIREAIMQERILPLLQILLTDKDKLANQEIIEDHLYSLLLKNNTRNRRNRF